MLFVETTLFTKLLSSYLPDDEYAKLQEFLCESPDAGEIIQGTSGLRKLRWSLMNKCKRGGLRIIYYWYPIKEHIYLFTLYKKSEIEDLSEKDKKILKEILERWLS